jgi:GR25 family glycosyltransferase involved in LPS biosynthesis
MKTFAIVIKDNDTSETGYRNLCKSSKNVNNTFEIERFDAITPANVDECISDEGIRWNYPSVSISRDIVTGLIKTPYKTKNQKARIACAMSHFYLWKKSVELSEPILILEHDASFIKLIDFKPSDYKFGVLGINDPRGATRRSSLFYDIIQKNNEAFQPVPTIDEDNIPQGLAGNSAYIIKPSFAKDLIEAVYFYGLWPNDALMCKQIFPARLGVTKKFYTTIQKLESTTVN